MNEQQDLERIVAEHVAGLGPLQATDGAILKTIDSARRRRQRPQWLALIKEPPMRTNSRLTVGSPTARVAAVLAATFLLAVALAAVGVAGQRLLAAQAAIVVAQDGSGDYVTIGEAVAAAEDGDTIHVRPGRYVESVAIIGKTVQIAADGERDQVIVEAATTEYPDVGLESDSDSGVDAWAFVLSDTESTISGLTVLGNDYGQTIVATGADTAPTLDGLVVLQLGSLVSNSSIGWRDGASGVLRDSVVEGYIDVTVGTPQIVGNELRRTCIDIWPDEPADTHVDVHGNVLHGCPNEYGVWVENASAAITGNEIFSEEAAGGDPDADSEGRVGIILGGSSTDVTVFDNDIHDSLLGLRVAQGAQATIEGNRFAGDERGVEIASDDATFAGNDVSGGDIGVLVGGGSPTIQGNTIEGADRGLVVGFAGTPTIVDNTICGNATNLEVNELAEEPAMSGNEICEDEPAS